MNTVIARMQPRVLIGRQVEKGERIVGPGAPSVGEKWVGRICLARYDQTTGTFQADIAVLVPAHAAILAAFEQGVFCHQKLRKKTVLGEIRKIIAILQAQSHCIDLGLCLQH